MLSLPDEVLLMIFSFLTGEDKISVRNSCRRLRDVASDPSLWRGAVALNYHGPRDDPRLESYLKLTVPHASKFALTAVSIFECATSKFLPLMKQSPSVTSVSLRGYQITQVELNAIVSALPRLMDLEVQLSFDSASNVMAALECTSRLQSLVVSCRIDPELIVRVWSNRASYNPPQLGIQLLGYSSNPDKSCSWRSLSIKVSDLPSTKHEARLLVYYAPSAFTRLSDLLVMQVEFRPSQSPVVPLLHLSSANLPDRSPAVCLSGGGMGSCDYLTAATNKYLDLSRLTFPTQTCIPSSLTHLLLDKYSSLTSSNLEEFAKHCPKLIRLSLADCSHVFEDSLQGLAAVAARCPRLEDLNLSGIHFFSVECVDSLLEILCQMHLIRLVVHACLLGSRASTRSNTSTTQALTSLTALEVPLDYNPLPRKPRERARSRCCCVCLRPDPHARSRSCSGCVTSDVVSEVVMHSMLTSLEYIRLSYSLLNGLLERVQHLKYLYIYSKESVLLPRSIMWYSCLEQVYIRCTESTLTEDNTIAITSGGKITHAILLLSSIDEESIRRFMHNSPRLVLFAIWTRTKMTEECVEDLSMVAKSRGVLFFMNTYDLYDTSMISGSDSLLSMYPSKLFPLFTH